MTLLAVALSWWAQGAVLPSVAPQKKGPEEALTIQLALHSNLEASPSDVHWIDGPPALPAVWRSARAWVLAARPKERDDVYLVRARLSPEGNVVEVNEAYNLTQTSAVGETHLVAEGPLVSYAATGSGTDTETIYSVHLMDASRAEADPEQELDQIAAFQLAVTRWQNTGQPSGVFHRSFKLDPPAKQWWARALDDRVEIVADGHDIELSPEAGPITGGRYVAEQVREVAAPGNLITWAVDRVRAIEWFGDERMQLLKAVVYKAMDIADRSVGGLDETSLEMTSIGDTLAPVKESEGAPGPTRGSWPPPRLEPFLEPPMPEEGVWLDLRRDPFVRNVAQTSTFLTTFIRPDPDRELSKVMVVLWDPNLVELHLQSGTKEPKSATGEVGSGLIPRTDDVLKRVVAAFNGGFQGTHGDFGMMVERTVFVPPRPYAATVARLKDGSVGFGTWPNDPHIPEQFDGFRQNLTPLIEAGRFNPWGRLWWGGVPAGWEDDTRTVRSALCLTRLGHVAYFYGAKVDHTHLGKAMLRAECTYGMHLDMNQGHTGLEFYHVDAAEHLPPLGMPPHPMWQAEGEVDGAPGYRFRGRRLFRSMQLMNFPRYIRRGERDFFYLTLRHLLPGAEMATAVEAANAAALTDEGRWRLDGLPAQQFPYAFVHTTLRPAPTEFPESKVRVVKLDPRRLAVTSDVETALFSIDSRAIRDAPSVRQWLLSPASAAQDGAVPAPPEAANAKLPPRAAIGRSTTTGFVVYAEIATGLEPGSSRRLLDAALEYAGCNQRAFLAESLGLVLRDGHELSGHPAPARAESIAFRQVQPSGFQEIFKDTPVLDRSVWKSVQKRGFAH